MTLDQIIAFHTLMCEAQKIIESWNAEDDADQVGDDFEKYEDNMDKVQELKKTLDWPALIKL